MAELSARKVAASEFGKRSVLIVADSAGLRTIMADMCRSLAFRQVDVSKSPAEAVDKLNVVAFDFVLCKWTQPPFPAPAFVQRVRGSTLETVRRTPIVVVGEYSQADLASGEGLTAILHQPFSLNALAQAFETVIV